MHLEEVMSTRVRSISYYPSERILEIVFVDSTNYQYINVSKSTYNAFHKTKLKGRFFDNIIKGNYLCRKIG